MKLKMLGFAPVTDGFAEGLTSFIGGITFFRSILLLVIADLSLMVYREFYGADLRALIYHAIIGITLLFWYYRAFVHKNVDRAADLPKELSDFWLLTVFLPSFVGMLLYDILWRIGLQNFATEWDAVKHGILIGELYFMPLVGLLLGWKFIRSWAKTKY